MIRECDPRMSAAGPNISSDTGEAGRACMEARPAGIVQPLYFEGFWSYGRVRCALTMPGISSTRMVGVLRTSTNLEEPYYATYISRCI